MQVILDEVLVNYETVGKKGKNDFLFLHGWGRSLKDWGQIAANVSNGNRVFLMDMPGFGGSPIPKKTFGIGDYAEVVIDFIDKLKLKNVVLIGHSFGGKIGTVVAAKSNKVRKLVLVGASGIAERSLGRRVKKYLSKIFKPIYRVLPSFLGERIFEALVSDDYRNAGKLKSIFQKIVSQNVEKEAGEIRIPTLIVWGDKDKEVPLSSAKKFEKLIADSYVRIIWNTGHDSFLEKPNKFLEILEEFLYD